MYMIAIYYVFSKKTRFRVFLFLLIHQRNLDSSIIILQQCFVIHSFFLRAYIGISLTHPYSMSKLQFAVSKIVRCLYWYKPRLLTTAPDCFPAFRIATTVAKVWSRHDLTFIRHHASTRCSRRLCYLWIVYFYIVTKIQLVVRTGKNIKK